MKLKSNTPVFGFVPKRPALLGLICGWLLASSNGIPAIPDGVTTNLADLVRVANVDQSRVASVHIEGTVWWSSAVEGRVILHDDSATAQLELDLPCEMPAIGDRLVLDGDCTVTKTRDLIKLSGVPVVENGGLHPPEEKSGTIRLKAGHYPICVAWFNRTDRSGLDVDYEGPGIARQKVMDDVLFHLSENATPGTTNLVSGLNYRYCEGAWWSHLPNFDHIAAVKTGIVNNFDITVKNRESHVGLQFYGYIKVPQDGMYTFYVRSDDGSRLFIGDSSLQIRTVGHDDISSLHTVFSEPVQDVQPEFQWTEIEGTVASFHRSPGALEVDVMQGSDLVRLKVAEDSDCSYTLRPQNRIRAVGVGRRIRNLDGSWFFGDFFVQRWDDIEQQYITPSIWNEYPLVEIGSLREAEPLSVVGAVVHISGTLKMTGSAQSMEMEDRSGRILLDGAVPGERVGRSSEVLGLLSLNGSDLVLRCTRFQQLGEPGSETNSLPVLTTAEQVCQLSMEEAARGYPVRLRGVITSPNEYEGAVIQDASRGIYLWLTKPENVRPDDWKPIAVQMGDYCEVEGVTAPYQFNPFIQVTKLQKLGVGSLPEPVQPTWDQLINGSLQCNYVELEGVVASIKDDTIALLTRAGRINVRLNPIGQSLPDKTLGATVRLRGCLLADWDGESHRVVVGSIYLDQHRVTVVHPAPVDPFAIPLKGVGDLLQFDPQGGALQRVRVSGVLVYRAGPMCHLMDGENGLRFLPAETVTAAVGDKVEVVGFPDLSGPSPLLREAVVRRLGPAGLPEPRTLVAGDLLHDEYDSSLVKMDGVLLSAKSTPAAVVLELQAGIQRFMATVEDAAALESDWTPGSRLELTGVYIGLGGDRVLGRPIDSFELLIHSGHNIRVLSRPPWWTLGRMLMVVGLLFGVLFSFLVWINLLHRKVEERTQQLGDQIRKRERAEHQREIEQERARLAHDLHDDLGAGLTEANMLSLLVTSPVSSDEEKARCADEMNDLLLRMVMSLDEIVWAENPRNDMVSSLAGYFGAHAQRLLDLASINCGLDIAEDLPDSSLDPKFRQELFLAFKEAITNVIQHAKAKKVWLRIAIEGDDIVIVVSDDGCGIEPGVQVAGADGLMNMRNRMNALGGTCEIQSDPEKGTTVRLQAPIKRVES